ncbi:MAG: type II toxin-antitoxin system prevent-host-death family antitoxin [Coriobacteriales bacterium]|jgi:prevent-host-death family protein|nr:type II toxin-antitoxin system prevent-host-death family antitoxin [Coriobacteriales bacterium]
MVQEVTAVKFRQNLGEMIARVQYSNDAVIINKGGKPAAALIDSALYERIRRMWDIFDRLTDKVADAYASVPEDEGMAEIEAVSASVRSEARH